MRPSSFLWMVVFYQEGVSFVIIYLQMIDSPGNRSKFEILYYTYRDIMYQAAFKILHNEHDAEDAVHQAFLKLAEIIDNVDGTLCARTSI